MAHHVDIKSFFCKIKALMLSGLEAHCGKPNLQVETTAEANQANAQIFESVSDLKESFF